MGFSYNKRKNIVELAVLRGSTARLDGDALANANIDSEVREADIGWPGMMSIRVNELDGMYDHPILPMSGDCCQLLEIQCHSKLAARRFQKPKKGQKADGSDDNGDVVQDPRSRLAVDLIALDSSSCQIISTFSHGPFQLKKLIHDTTCFLQFRISTVMD